MGPEYGHQLDINRNIVLDEDGKPFRIQLPKVIFDNGKVFYDSIEEPQQRFLNDMSKFQCVVGQVGCGKSAMASAKALYHSYCYKNNLGFILMKSMRQMDIAAVRSFKEVCPRRLVWRESEEHVLLLNYIGVKFMKDGGKDLPKKQQESQLEELGGLSTVVYTSFEGTRAALKKWASANIGWYMIDQAEESDIKLYKMLLHRLRKDPSSRQAWFIANLREDLPIESLWIWKLSSPESPHKLNSHSYMEMHTHMNRKNLPQDFLDSLEEGLNQREYAHYVSGDKDKIGMTKAVFTEFSTITNVIKHVDPPDSWEKGVGLDVGLSNPTAFVQVAKLPTGELYVYEEFKEQGEVSSYYAKQIAARRTEKHRLFAIDATAGNRSRVTLTSEIDEYLRWGLPFIPAKRDVMAGINRLREYMKFNPGRFNPFTNQPGSSMLFISDRCQELIREIQQYRYEESKSVGFVNEPERVRDYDNHLVDALRFIVVMMTVALTAASDVNATDIPSDQFNPNVKKQKFNITADGNLSFDEIYAEALKPVAGQPNRQKRYTSSWSVPPEDPHTGVIVPGRQLPSKRSERSIYTSTWMEKR